MAERHTNPKERAALRVWCVRALRSRNQHGSLPDANVRKKLTRDSGYGKGGAVWDAQRRRRRGLQGRPQKAAVVRGLLFEWFSVLRNSVAARIPPKLVMVKAAQLVEDYVKECLLRGVQPGPPKINSQWMRGWRRQYRVSLRRPNRKYKVPKHVLEERLVIFWTNLARLRCFVQLAKGYDPQMTSIDQTPYHTNEAGSQGATTLSVNGGAHRGSERGARGHEGAVDREHNDVLRCPGACARVSSACA